MSGKLKLISSATASNSASVEFTSGIDSTYDEYVFYWVDINPATNDTEFSFQVNATDDAGGGYDTSLITSTFFDVYHNEDDSGAALEYRTGPDLAQSASRQSLGYYFGNGSDESGVGEFHLFSPSSTSKVKHFYSQTQHYYSNDVAYGFFVSGYINDTTAIEEIQFKFSSGNFDGNIYLFGVS